MTKLQKKNWRKVEKILKKFHIKFGESMQKMCEIQKKKNSRTFESKNFRIEKTSSRRKN